MPPHHAAVCRGVSGEPLGQGNKGRGSGEGGMAPRPRTRGLARSRGHWRSWGEAGVPPPHNLVFTATRTADARWHVEQSCSAERERQENGGTVLCRRATSGERHTNRVRSSQISNGFC